jgi:hypothetical protein
MRHDTILMCGKLLDMVKGIMAGDIEVQEMSVEYERELCFSCLYDHGIFDSGRRTLTVHFIEKERCDDAR